jgi:hypothetical protein
MEGFLQSLKVKDPEKQVQICALSGGEARGRGQRHIWNVDGFLYWRGEPIDRLSDAYQALLDRAYEALCAQSAKFRAALAASRDCDLKHSIGKDDPTETILTPQEFLSRLLRLRAAL